MNPIDCDAGSDRSTVTLPNGDQVDLCAQRCVYSGAALNDLGGVGSINTTKELLESYEAAGTTATIENTYVISGSCFEDTDCSGRRSLKGDIVEGQCRTQVDLASDGSVKVDVPRLANDTNRVMKVNRDRTCSEWVACSSSRPVWDEDLGQYREVCEDILLCEEYSQTGDSTFCKKWKLNDAAIFLDADEYASRDVSWHGEEYSGYSIPDSFAMQHLDQIEVSPELICLEPGAQLTGNEAACSSNLDCSGAEICSRHPDPEYILGLDAGSCDQDNFNECTVGFCTDTGSACSSNDQCSDGICSIGICHVAGGACSQNSDCTGVGEFCDIAEGVCKSSAGEFCGLDGSCSVSGATCTFSNVNRVGSCINEQCVVGIDGEPIRSNREYETAICRAHPEPNSPFGNHIVERWAQYDVDDNNIVQSTDSHANSTPYDVKSGFEQASLCAPGETCECSYKKIESSGGSLSYLSAETDLSALAKDVAEIVNPGANMANPRLGICSGGSADGALCVQGSAGNEFGCSSDEGNIDLTDASAASLGRCNLITREDTLLGLKGYCLERDTGLNINGDPTLGACLTWYPVDQIRGETDLFAKFTEAGFFNDSYYCSDIRSYANVGPFLGCSAIRGESGEDTNDLDDEFAGGSVDQVKEGNRDWCAQTVHCPDGYFALVGSAYDQDNQQNSGTFAEQCRGSGTLDAPDRIAGDLSDAAQTYDLWDRAVNACPFMCVPMNSFHESSLTGQASACTPPSDADSDGFGVGVCENTGAPCSHADQCGGASCKDKTKFYYGDMQKFDTWVNDYNSCRHYGYDYENDILGIQDYLDETGTEGTNQFTLFAALDKYNSQYRGTNINAAGGSDVITENPLRAANYYPACRDLIQLSSGSDLNAHIAPYTDRLYQSNYETNNKAFKLNAFLQAEYVKETPGIPFGASVSPTSVAQNLHNIPDPAPAAIPSYIFENWVRVDDSALSDHEKWRPTFHMPFGLGAIVDSATQFVANNVSVNTSLDLVPAYGLTSSISDVQAMQFVMYGRGGNLFANFVTFPSNAIQTGPGEGISDVRDRLASIYALPYKLWRWIDDDGGNLGLNSDDGLGAYDEQSEGQWPSEFTNGNWDTRDVGNPPVVYAVDFDNCNSVSCFEGAQDNITVNGQSTGDIDSEGGFFRASVSFFAAADKNQLPLRRILVDWGDGSAITGSTEDDNLYKNHRGIDSITEEVICESRSEWGMTPDSCDSNYVAFSHTYTCDEARIVDLPDCSGAGAVNCVEGRDTAAAVCVFQPSVHVRDNWGWCTTPNATVCGGNGCFDSDPIVDGPGDDRPKNECNYEKDNPNINPWIPYAGVIRVQVE